MLYTICCTCIYTKHMYVHIFLNDSEYVDPFPFILHLLHILHILQKQRRSIDRTCPFFRNVLFQICIYAVISLRYKGKLFCRFRKSIMLVQTKPRTESCQNRDSRRCLNNIDYIR